MAQVGPTYWQQARDIVDVNLRDMNDRADASLATANGIIQQLASLSSFALNAPPPQFTAGASPPIVTRRPTQPAVPQFASVTYTPPPWEELRVDVDDILGSQLLQELAGDFDLELPFTITPPDDPTIGPGRPAPTPPQNLPTINLPVFNPNDYLFPPAPDYIPIDIPAAPTINLQPFTETPPTFTETPPDTRITFEYEAYESVLLDALKAKVQEMMAGGIGLPESVEQGLYDRAREREDQASAKAVDEAFETFASRGFSMPPGMLAKQVNAAIEDNRLKAQGHNREVLIEAAKWRIENVRVALERGVAIEAALIQQHDSMMRLTFEAAKANSDAAVARFNLLVSAYDVAARVFQLRLTAWEAGLKLEIEKLNAYRAQVEAEQAKAQVNEALARAYTAAVNVVSEKVGVFRALTDAELGKAQIIRALLEAYAEEVRAHTAGEQLRYIDFQRYEAATRVEAAKAQVNEAYARAFAETLQAQTSAVNAKARAIEARSSALGASAQKFQALIQGEASKVSAEAQRIGAQAQVFGAQTGMFSAEAGLYTAELGVESQRIADALRNALAYYEINVRQFDAQQTRLIEAARLQSEAIRAAGQMAAQLAAGAMAAINVGANLSGNASSTDSFSYNLSKSIAYDGEDNVAF